MRDEKYNGWTNYETWRINLEIIDGTDEIWKDYKSLKNVAEAMEEYVNEILDQCGKGLALDYARYFISNVDWLEIASHYYEEENEDENVETADD
jgi:hypothetical protein